MVVGRGPARRTSSRSVADADGFLNQSPTSSPNLSHNAVMAAKVCAAVPML